jgi:hypothetical protein
LLRFNLASLSVRSSKYCGTDFRTAFFESVRKVYLETWIEVD